MKQETPCDKVTRLAYELAQALNEYGDGRFHALVYPADKAKYPVAFKVNGAVGMQL